jgi:hypothetical protein
VLEAEGRVLQDAASLPIKITVDPVTKKRTTKTPYAPAVFLIIKTSHCQGRKHGRAGAS